MTLSPNELAAVERVRKSVASEHEYCKHDFNVHRWIVAYDGDEEEAAKVLKRHLNIREVMRFDELPEEKSEDIDHTAELYAPLTILGRNHPDDNKVLILEQSGQIDINGLVDNLRMTRFMRSKFKVMETLHRRCVAEEQRSERQSGAVLIMDLQSLQLNTRLLSVLSGPYRIMWGTLFEQYPQLIREIIIVNAPTFVNVLYQTCIPFIPQDYRSRIVITSGDKTNATLLKHIHPSCLPPEFGGEQSVEDCDDFEVCSRITPPQAPFPVAAPLEIDLQTVSIPAGGAVYHVHKWTKDTPLEFFLFNESEFTYFIFYSEEHTEDETKRREIYAGSERPAMAQTDYWTWKVPLDGYYYIRFGNEKAWLFSVSIQQAIRNRTTKETLLHLEQF